MKGKIFLLLGIGFIPLALSSQSVFLYNKGQMSVKTGNNANTALYIGGDLISETTGSIYLEEAKVVLTGDLYRYGTASSSNHVFDVNNYANYATKTKQSSLWFKGSKPQRVWRGTPASGKAYNPMDFQEKSNNAIYFPNIVIENKNHVTIHPEIGASAYDIIPEEGRLILDSRKLRITDLGDHLPSGSTIHSDNNSSILAHLKVNGVQDMSKAFLKEGPTRTLDQYGGVQVNLALSGIYEDGRTESSRFSGDAIVGMGSPFQGMRADYFMFNFLFMPTGNSIFNKDGNTSVDPLLEFKPGRGFVVGIDLRGGDASAYTDIHPFYSTSANYGYQINFKERVSSKYQFNRFAYGMNSNNLFQVAAGYTSTTVPSGSHRNRADRNVKPSDVNGPYVKEVLNTKDITPIPLVKGFNYLSNPYTCPIDVSDLIFNTSGGTVANGWGVKPGYTAPGAPVGIVGDIANRVWVMSPSSVASGTYNIWSGGTTDNPGNKWVVAQYRYNVMAHVGATNVTPYDNGQGGVAAGDISPNGLIAPLQMFLVFANKDVNITIPASKRKIDENALYLRSSGVNKFEPDDFLFEVEDLDKGTTDRTAVVLRTFSEINDKGYKDVKRLVTDVTSNEDGKTRAFTSEGVVKASPISTLYTKDSDGSAIESRFLAMDLNAPATTTTLYLTPSLTEHEISIRSFRNFTKDKITEILLEDLKTGKSIILSEGAIYKTKSSPNDDPARFRLNFRTSPVGGIGDENNNSNETSITAYYSNNTLTVSGFNDSDYGSQVSVYDIQGRLVKQQKVDGASVVFNDGFTVGAYIVKVTGNRSYATKFLAR